MPSAVIADNGAELDKHVGFIVRQADKSIREGGARQLAVKIVSGSFDYARDPRTGREVKVVRCWGRSFIAPAGPVCPSRDDTCEVDRIWDFVVLNMRYVYDPTEYDTFATLKESLISGGGDCDDMAIAFAALLGSLGFHVAARVISTPEAPNDWVHIYPMVGLPKDNPRQWMPLDTTVEGATPGWEYDAIARYKDYRLI